MPRLSIPHSAGWNEPFDYCRRCWPLTEDAAIRRGFPRDLDYDVEHPDYEDDEYGCDACGVALTERDN